MKSSSSQLYRPFHASAPGAAPGIQLEELRVMPNRPGRVLVSCLDYDSDHFTFVSVLDIDAFLAEHRPPWVKVRWINVAGLTDMGIIHALAQKYQLHPLAIEDMLQSGTRPKVETYPGDHQHHARTFIVARKIHLAQQELHCEQICMFAGEHTLLTFQETHSGVWDPVRQRICKDASRLRHHDLGYLVYALLDAIVDHCFPILEHYSDQLQDLELEVLNYPEPAIINRIHLVKRELLLLRREFRPMREVIHQLQHGEHANLSGHTAVFMRDIYDHSIQVLDMLETYREIATGLTETYMNVNSQRMNQVMKVLTIISTLFMPLSFIAGVFGMNFHHMPELQSVWIYPYGFWMLCLSISASMFFLFRRNQWL